MQRASLHGFLVTDHADRCAEAIGHLAELLVSGALHYDEVILDGLQQAPSALDMLFAGTNTGKVLVRLAEPTDVAQATPEQ